MDHEQTFRTSGKNLIKLAIPLIGTHLANVALGITDTIMMGWYSVTALAALVLGNAYFFVFFLFGAGFAFAVQPLVASASSAGELKLARRYMRMGLWLSLIYASLFLPIFFNSEPILILLGQAPDISGYAENYTRIIGFGLIPALWAMVIRFFLSGLHLTKVTLIITLTTVLLNIPLNYLLIFGNLGFPELGVSGAAISSVIVQIITAVSITAYAIRKLPEYKLLTRFFRFDKVAFVKVGTLGLPIGTSIVAETGLFTASSIMMGWFGAITLAAHGIALQIASVMFMIHLGLAEASTIKAGNAWGSRNLLLLKKGAKIAASCSILFSLAAMTVLITFGDTLVAIYVDIDDPSRTQIIYTGALLLVAAALFQFVDGGQAMALGLLRGIQDTTVPMLITILSYWLVGVPSAYFFAFVLNFKSIGIWAGLATGLGFAAILLGFRFVYLTNPNRKMLL